MITTEIVLIFLGVICGLTVLVGLNGGWRWARRMFLFGLVAGCVQLALIELTFGVGTWAAEVSR